MLTVHHLETSRSQRVLWLLEDLGVPYEIKLYKRDPRTHLAHHTWFAGENLSLADVQMSFAVAALLARSDTSRQCPHLAEYMAAIEARPAYQRALAKGGPVIMAT